MKVKRTKLSFTYFFLVLFISMKMMGLHTFSHSDEENHAEHCEICDDATILNITPLKPSVLQEFSIENNELALQLKVTTDYGFIALNTIACNQLFSRPPPFTV